MAEDLFNNQQPLHVPMAEALRPQNLSDIVGQKHLLGPGKSLNLAFASKIPHSMILWGPPGVGKTTIARLACKYFEAELISLSAVYSGVKEIRQAIDRASILTSRGKASVLFIDEIHRFNKSQQDALLPFVESGQVTFIGATTENPSFEINSALLSRAQVYVLKALEKQDFLELFDKILKRPDFNLEIDPPALDLLIKYAEGDARKFINIVEQCKSFSQAIGSTKVDLNFVSQSLPFSAKRFDKDGDLFHEQISALHKSVRGSHPNAALYWFCRMLDAGTDPKYLSRRIIRMAWEDIGLADPKAVQIANDAASTYERLGSPEGELALAQAIIYMAVAAKSNAGYLAYSEARAFVKHDTFKEVPLHLRNAPTDLLKTIGYAQDYRYSHDEPNAYSAGEVYMPDGMEEPSWYRPTPRGLEGKISEKLKNLKELDDHENSKKARK